jgi:hypothetical protein|tara:strand:+ start:74 stop:448 length:375 start_codon:yes stop_codon:yes gene_type:complete
MPTTNDIDDHKEITNVLTDHYLRGAISGKSSEMKPSFHNDSSWYGYVGSDLIAGPIQTLYDWHDGNGAAKDLVYNIPKIDIVGTVASVRIELDNWRGARFTDLLNMLKVDGKWQVMNKVFYLHT